MPTGAHLSLPYKICSRKACQVCMYILQYHSDPKKKVSFQLNVDKQNTLIFRVRKLQLNRCPYNVPGRQYRKQHIKTLHKCIQTARQGWNGRREEEWYGEAEAGRAGQSYKEERWTDTRKEPRGTGVRGQQLVVESAGCPLPPTLLYVEHREMPGFLQTPNRCNMSGRIYNKHSDCHNIYKSTLYLRPVCRPR